MLRNVLLLGVSVAFISACASTAVTPISRNQVMISTSAAPVCGVSGAQRVAAQMAAVETIRRGYARFLIGGMQAQNNVRAIRTAPTGAFTTGSFNRAGNTIYGNTSTTYTGGGVMMTGSNDASLLVTMMNPGEPGYANGVDAKATLGEKWQELVKNGISSCS